MRLLTVYRYNEKWCVIGLNGVCHDFTAPEKVIQTMEFEGLPETGHVVMESNRKNCLPKGAG